MLVPESSAKLASNNKANASRASSRANRAVRGSAKKASLGEAKAYVKLI